LELARLDVLIAEVRFEIVAGAHGKSCKTAALPVMLILEHATWQSRYRTLLDLPPDHEPTPWLVGFALAALAIYAPIGFRSFFNFQF